MEPFKRLKTLKVKKKPSLKMKKVFLFLDLTINNHYSYLQNRLTILQTVINPFELYLQFYEGSQD